jgi:Tfp pilus assembly PilM family ATPase
MNPLSRLIAPRLPSAAIGLSGEGVGVVQLERRRDVFSVRRAGYVPLPEGLLVPGFDEGNVSDPNELANTLAELASSTGMAKRRRWSVALPEAATRTSILTMETATASRHEGEEMLRWKIERTVGAPLDELRVARERLAPDSQGRARHLVTAVRLSVLAEYESVFEALGWRAGLVVPRHMGEAAWLSKGPGSGSDSLLVSSHADGFTAVVLRAGQPLYVRGVICEVEDRTDELYRFMLFYRDRSAAPGAVVGESAHAPTDTIGQLLVAGTGLDAEQASAVVEETLAAPPRTLHASDVRLAFPSDQIDFRQIAAPAGLAALAWG